MIGATDPDRAREQAREILDGSRYQPTELPRPLEGVLEWLGRRLRPVAEAWGAFFDWIFDAPLPVQLAALALAVGLVAFAARRIAALRSGPDRAAAERRRREDASVDPDDLERAAEGAEEVGDLDRALRLRFRAGLVRLDEVGLIEFRPSITSGEVARRLRLEAFERLAAHHDEVVYGGRAATAGDLAEARSTWPELVGSR